MVRFVAHVTVFPGPDINKLLILIRNYLQLQELRGNPWYSLHVALGMRATRPLPLHERATSRRREGYKPPPRRNADEARLIRFSRMYHTGFVRRREPPQAAPETSHSRMRPCS